MIDVTAIRRRYDTCPSTWTSEPSVYLRRRKPRRQDSASADFACRTARLGGNRFLKPRPIVLAAIPWRTPPPRYHYTPGIASSLDDLRLGRCHATLSDA